MTPNLPPPQATKPTGQEMYYPLHLKLVNALGFYVVTGFFAISVLILMGLVDLEKPNVSVVAGMIIGHAATMAGVVVTAYFHARRSTDQPNAYEGIERRTGLERRSDDAPLPPDPPGVERRSGEERRRAGP